MAIVRRCKYCPRNVVNSQWHPECRLAKLEGFLYQVKSELKWKNESEALRFKDFEREILAETFRSKEEIEQEFKRVEELELAKELWKNAFIEVEAMQKDSIEWHREHPDPDPPTC